MKISCFGKTEEFVKRKSKGTRNIKKEK